MPIGSRGRSVHGAAGWVPPGQGGDGGGGGTGDAPARFYQTAPDRGSGDGPTGAAIVYDSSYSGSLQDALSNLNSGERVWIDPADGPYGEDCDYDVGPDSFTIDGYDPGTDTRAELVMVDDTTSVFSCSSNRINIGNNLSSYSETTIRNPIDPGDTVIDVDDASALTCGPGDAMQITEQSDMFQDGYSSGDIGEFRTVESIDTSNDTVTVTAPMLMRYPLAGPTGIGDFEDLAYLKDVEWYGLDVAGTGRDSSTTTPFNLYATIEPWLENLHVHDTIDNLIRFNECYRSRVKDVLVTRTGGNDTEGHNNYGLSFGYGCCNSHVTNVEADDVQRYTLRVGSNRNRATTDTYADHIIGQNMAIDDAPTYKSHYGGFFSDIHRLEVKPGASGPRIASREHTINGISIDGNSDGTAGSAAFISTGRTDNHHFLNTPDYIDGWDAPIIRNREGNRIFQIAYTNDNEWAGTIRYENLTIDDDRGASDPSFGWFRFGGADAHVKNLEFINVFVNGVGLTVSDVESWDGYDSNLVQNLTVENPGGSPP